MAGSSLKPHSTSSDWPRELAKRAVKQKCESRGGDAPFGWSADAHEVYVFGKLVLQTENKKRADKCYAELIAKAEAMVREAIALGYHQGVDEGRLEANRVPEFVRRYGEVR